tara:strand:+ start:2389 stop:3408 length:1020 start_codon:yes stop_codon:yes gene_type:complete
MSIAYEEIINENKAFIIAEIGANHNCEISLAYELIDAAFESGADAVKFQSIQINELYYLPNEATKSLHSKLDLDGDWFSKLKEYSDKRGIIFFSSPTYLKAVDTMEELGVDIYKLASAQIGTFPQIIEKVAKLQKTTLLSTGLVTYGGLEKVVKIFKACKNNKFVILHCNSIYPTPYEKVDLNLINVYRNMFGKPVGYSDHTSDIYIPIAAVSMGACVIEKHFTLDRQKATPDACVSLEPDEFNKMVTGIRNVEQALKGGERTEIHNEEKKFKNSIIYRLILERDKRQGEGFDIEDFVFKRHPNGIDCRDIEYVIKFFKAKADISKGVILSWGLLEGKE